MSQNGCRKNCRREADELHFGLSLRTGSQERSQLRAQNRGLWHTKWELKLGVRRAQSIRQSLGEN